MDSKRKLIDGPRAIWYCPFKCLGYGFQFVINEETFELAEEKIREHFAEMHTEAEWEMSSEPE